MSGDAQEARALSNPDLSPHVSFVDMAGHGYTVVHVSSGRIEAEFVCIPRPVERSERADGGPLVYRTRRRTGLWRKGERPSLELQILEGDPRFSF
jgi:alkaline phosphatase D